MSAFLERRQRPLGNTFIEEESESDCETPRRVPPMLRRRFTFSHITLSHEEREVDIASLRHFAQNHSILPKASLAECVRNRGTVVDSCSGDSSPSTGSHSKVIFLCNTVPFSSAVGTGACAVAAPQMPWAADTPATPAAGGNRIPCLPLDSLIPPHARTASSDHSEPRTPTETWTWASEDQDTWASESEQMSLDFSSAPPSSEASSSRRRGGRRSGSVTPAGQSGVAKVCSDASVATSVTTTASSVQRQRTTKGKQKKAVSPASSSTASTTGSSPANRESAPVVEKAPARQQPRADLVKELRRTGASALERALALAKDLSANRPEQRSQ